MLNRSNLIYIYDGSFEGLICCVFESYYKHEIPMDIVKLNTSQITFFPTKEIITDLEKYNRVLVSIKDKIGLSALKSIQYAFLSCLEKKELYILLFLRMGYKYGPSVITMLSHDVVATIFKAIKHLENESHLLKGLIRFSVFNNGLAAEIEPKNFVLPLLIRHFSERYPEEYFLIHDKTHNMALIYKPYEANIIPVENMTFPSLAAEEKHFRKLWGLYYNTVEIRQRHNPKCQMSHMPKRYWKYLTEFTYNSKL